jgi:hypothetical protein
MAKILLLSILLVLVYQFDQIVGMVYLMLKKISRGRVKWVVKESDHYVGTAVTIVTMPLLLYSVMVSNETMLSKLLWLTGIYFLFAVVAGGAWYFIRQAKLATRQKGGALVFAFLSVIGGMFHPGIGLVPWPSDRDRLVYSKLAFLLSVPGFFGAVIKFYYDNYLAELGDVIDSLIVVMIGGLFINVVVKFLEKHFRVTGFGLLSYARVLAGLGVAVILVV